MVKVQAISHSFGSQTVLKDINLQVNEGEILAIMGSSGGGKTTLLKCIAGLIKPTKGDILVDDLSVVTHPDQVHGKIGMVFQYAALFDFLNVRDNLLFGVKRHKKLSAQQKTDLVTGLLNDLGLPGVEERMPSELSGGMRKRVGLARALALEPKVLLYDEPTSGLDPVTAYSIDGLIVETRDRLGTTSIVVSHDVSSVFRVADRIVFLHKGEILFNGSSDEFRKASSGPIKELVEAAKAETIKAGN